MSGADWEPDWTDGVIGHTRAGLRANRENPVWRLTWGREPASPRRRRRAWIALFAPSAVSFLTFLTLSSIFNKNGDFKEVIPYVVALLTSLIMMLLVFIGRIMAPVPTLLRPESRDELTMAGLSGRDRLWGANSPGLCGVALAGLVQAVMLPLSLSLALLQQRYGKNISTVTFYLFFITLPTFLMVTGAFLEAALRGLTLSRLARAAGVGLLIFLLGIYSVGTVIIFLQSSDLEKITLMNSLLFFGEVLAVIAVIARWRRTERRLEEPA